MKTKSVYCGDWHLGWGFGGYNKIGKLKMNDDGTFTWRGHAQGRHGQILTKKGICHFKIDDKCEIEVIKQNHALPVYKEVMKSITELTMQ